MRNLTKIVLAVSSVSALHMESSSKDFESLLSMVFDTARQYLPAPKMFYTVKKPKTMSLYKQEFLSLESQFTKHIDKTPPDYSTARNILREGKDTFETEYANEKDKTPIIWIWASIAATYIGEGNFAKALCHANKGLEIGNTYNYELYTVRARANIGLQNYQNAKEDVDRALAVGEATDDLWYIRAQVLISSIQQHSILRLVVICDSHFLKRYMFCCVQANQGLQKYDSAERDISKAINLNSSDAEYYYFRANNHAMVNCFKDGIRDLNKAIDIDNTKPVYFYVRALALYKFKKYDKALEDCNIVIGMHKENRLEFISDVYYLRSKVFLALKNFERASEDCQAGLQLMCGVGEDTKFFDLRKEITINASK